VPLWLKLAYTLFLAALVPIYWREYGPSVFLWFCDISLFLVLISLWFELPLPASMAALLVLPDVGWIVDLVARLLFGVSIGGFASYMFDSYWPLYVRLVSLFHLWLPVLLIWLIWRLGYDRKAILAQSILAWIVLACCYCFTSPQDNINWIFRPAREDRPMEHPLLYFWAVMALLPVAGFGAMHLLFRWLFKSPHGEAGGR